MRLQRAHSGVALITVLLLMALASILAVAMAERQTLDIRRTANVLNADQGYLYALGGEGWAEGLLLRDFEDDQKHDEQIDTLTEVWAKKLPVTPVEGGQISGYIEDMQGRFNLNNLYLSPNPGEQEKARFKVQLDLFRRLLRGLDINEEVAQAVADWIDADNERRFPHGAEDLDYLQLEKPYRTRNGFISDPSELRMVKGMNAEDYNKLRPYVCALPEPTPVNLNTAPAAVIDALSDEISSTMAESIAQQQQDQPFADTEAFFQAVSGPNDDKLRNELGDLVDVSSRYFMVHAHTAFGRANLALQSLIQRDQTGKTRVLARDRGER